MVEGQRPLLLSSTVRDDNAVLVCDLTNPGFVDPEAESHIVQDLLHIRRTRFLWNAHASSASRCRIMTSTHAATT
jgi:hypothetical protein